MATTKKKSPPAPKKSTTRPNPLADAALKRRYTEAIDRYRASRTQEMSGWDARYEALGEILDESLYLAAGHRSEAAFLAAEAPDLDPRSARTYVRVAKFFEPEDEARFGIVKLDLLLSYLEAAGGSTLATAKLRPEKTSVLVSRDKAARRVAFADVTAEELRVAARKARAASGGKKSSGRATGTPWVQAVRAALRAGKLGGVAVSERGKKLALSNIAVDDVPALGRALAKVKTPG